MNNGWVKLHRKILENENLAYDNTACLLFIKILLSADKHTGTFKTGRYKLALLTNEKPNTAYKALKRLEKWGIISLFSNNQMTVISICNWQEYQVVGNNEVTTKEQRSNNQVTLNKNKELRIKNNSNVEIQRIFDHYIATFKKNPNQYKLSNHRKIKISARLKDAGYEMLIKAIDNTANSDWHMGENDRAWVADLDFIIRSYEQVERLSNLNEREGAKKVYEW